MEEALTGAQKAAILLLKLGREHSAKVLKLLGDTEVTAITAEIVRALAAGFSLPGRP
jgi:flagellar motor switch protein FliG